MTVVLTASALAIGQAHAVESSAVLGKRASTTSSVDVPTSRLSLPAPTRTIHWAVKNDGSVELSDKPTSDKVARQGVQTYAGTTTPESAAQAQRQRDYWRAQSDAFASRQRERDRELDARRDAALARVERQYMLPAYHVVPVVPRWRHQHGVGGGNWAGAAGGLGATPQATALGGGPSPFLSSGFARTPGR